MKSRSLLAGALTVLMLALVACAGGVSTTTPAIPSDANAALRPEHSTKTSKPSPSPTPTKTATASPKPTATATASPKPTATPTASSGCWAPWVATTAYTAAGAQVSVGAENYQSAFYTKGANPATNNGPVGSGKPWIPEGACGVAAPTPSPAPNGLRVQVVPVTSSGYVSLPPATQDWTVQYEYSVPPLPTSPTWNYLNQTVYQWGQVEFDDYGIGGTYPLSNYVYNQIVPQLMIGNVLDGNEPDYSILGAQLSTWVIQAEYFWEQGTTPYSQTGNLVNVNPGDAIATTITYSASSGTILVDIADNNIPGAAGLSTMTIVRPFPNDPTLFASWTDFFNRAEAITPSHTVLDNPRLNVETYNLDQTTMCGLLPFTIGQISIPGFASTPSLSQFATAQNGTYTCPTRSKLTF